MNLYNTISETLHKKFESQEKNIEDPTVQRGQRPLKMPKGYDFSVRNIDWRSYKQDYLLRTDAVWEKQKLKDMFYATYKVSLVFDSLRISYMTSTETLTKLLTLELFQCQLMSLKCLRTGRISWVIQTLMDAL